MLILVYNMDIYTNIFSDDICNCYAGTSVLPYHLYIMKQRTMCCGRHSEKECCHGDGLDYTDDLEVSPVMHFFHPSMHQNLFSHIE